ncbi:MAG: hypothetical protein ACYTGB_07715, partial [Planctomycetota bacterium]
MELDGSVTVSTLTVNGDDTFAVATSGSVLTTTDAITVNGTLRLDAGTTLRAGGDITAAAGSTFQVAGTSQLPGGYATIEGNGGSYAITLSGNVDVQNARIYDLDASGMTLAASSGTAVLSNTYFEDGAAGATPYLRVTGSAWDGANFAGLAFGDAGGTKTRAVEITNGGNVTLSAYGSGVGYLSGDATDIETSGTITWGPTAAEGLEAEVRVTARGRLVTWTADVERNTAGYRVMRRRVREHPGVLVEESADFDARGHRGERAAGQWVKVG